MYGHGVGAHSCAPLQKTNYLLSKKQCRVMFSVRRCQHGLDGWVSNPKRSIFDP